MENQSMSDLSMKAVEALEQKKELLYKSFSMMLENIRSKHPDLQEDLFSLEEILLDIVVGTSEELYEVGFRQAINVVKDYGFITAIRLIGQSV